MSSGEGEVRPVSGKRTPEPRIWLHPASSPARRARRLPPWSVQQLDKQPADVRRMFDAVARRYDVTNDVLSLGQDRRWRGEVIARGRPAAGRRGAGPRGRHRHLEPAVRRPRRHRGAVRLLPRHARRSASRPARTCPSPRATAPGCPSPTTRFDAVTISFGLRNIVDPLPALREMRRVTRPGGRLVVCEFSHPTFAPFRTVYLEYLMKALPAIARDGLLLAGRLRLPGRVDPGLARPARPRRPGGRGRLAGTRVAQPLRRDRGPPPGRERRPE